MPTAYPTSDLNGKLIMHNIRNRHTFTLTIFLLFLPFLSACYGHSELTIYMNSFGYRYNLPNGWVESRSSDTELSIYGPEGKIDIQFLIPEATPKPDDVFDGLLHTLPATVTYTVSEFQHNGTPFFFAQLDEAASDENDISHYIMVFPFADDRVVVARGQPDQQYKHRFESLYKRIIFSLTPFDLPN